ncbi:hypothetical protein D3C80_1429110 [compost metagenome]
MRHGRQRDQAAKQQGRIEIADIHPLRHPVTGRRAEGKGDQDGEPVELLPPEGIYRINGKSAFMTKPNGKSDQQQQGKDAGREPERDPDLIGQVVGQQSTEDADQHHCQPVAPGLIAHRLYLQGEHHDQQSAHQGRRQGQPQMLLEDQIIRRRLADRGGHHLDDPEDQGHFRHLVGQGGHKIGSILHAASRDTLWYGQTMGWET